jgi:hypothetical protein
MQSVRRRLTYANVMSTLAVFLVVAGGSAVAATQLAKNSVGSNQLKKNAVTAAKIKNNAVTGGKIAKGAVTGAKLGGGAVGASNLSANSVTGAAIADGAVTGAKIGAGAVGTGNLANDAVNGSKLADNSVTGAKVQDGSLTGSDIQQNTLTQVKAGNVYGVTYAETGPGAPKLITATDPGIKSAGCFLACSVEFPVNVSECVTTVSSSGFGTGGAVGGSGEAIESSNPKTILVAMYDKTGTLTAQNFSMTVVCPSTS